MASYNYLISKQELKAYQQGHQPEVQASAIVKHQQACKTHKDLLKLK